LNLIIWILASLGFSLGITQCSDNEALHLRSSFFESHDDIVDGTTFLNPESLCDIPVFCSIHYWTCSLFLLVLC